MFNPQPMINLPVPADQMVTANFINGAPNNLPQLPQVPVSQNIAPYLPMIVGYLVSFIQNNAQKNAVRVFSFNMFSNNAWNNPAFLQAVSSVSEYAEALLAENKGTPDQVIQFAVNEFLECMAGVFVQQYPDLQRFLTQQDFAGVQAALVKFGNIQNHVATYKARMQQAMFGQQQYSLQQQNFQQPMQGFPMQRPMQQPQMMQPQFQQQGFNPIQAGLHQGRPMGLQQPMMGVPGSAIQHQNFQHPHNQPLMHDRVRTGIKPRQKQAVVEEFSEEGLSVNQQYAGMVQPSIPPTDVGGFPLPTRVNTPEYMQKTQPTTPPQQPPVSEAPRGERVDGTEIVNLSTDPKRPFDHQRLPDGTEIKPALTSGWVFTPTREEPFRTAYNPHTHVKFHARRPDGVVKEVIVEMKPSMEYINHELTNRSKQRREEQKVVPTWELLDRFTPIETVVERNKETPVDLTVTPVILPERIEAHSLSGALLSHASKMFESGLTTFNKSVTTFTANILNPVFTGSNHISKIKELCAATSLDMVAHRLKEQFDKTDSTYWYTANNLMTQRINQVLDNELGLTGWEIGSFVDDWSSLVEAMTEDPSVGEQPIQVMNEHAREIISSVWAVLTGDRLTQYLKTLKAGETKPSDEFLQGMLVFSETVSVTQVPWSLEDFAAELDTTPSFIKESSMKELYDTAATIFERALHTTGDYRHHYLITSDRKVIEFHRGYLAKGAFIARIVKPE